MNLHTAVCLHLQIRAALNAQMGACALVTTSALVHMGIVDPIVKTERALFVAKMAEYALCQIISANAEMDITEQDAIKSNYKPILSWKNFCCNCPENLKWRRPFLHFDFLMQDFYHSPF